MSRTLVTGSAGFIGQRITGLLRTQGHEVLTYDVGDTPSVLRDHVSTAEFIFHLAGVNRPPDPAAFQKVNADLTQQLCELAINAARPPVLVLASSTQALLDNPYGVSKRHAEKAVERYARDGGRAVIFRLPNVFGPGCRPNYNSVVATFAYNVVTGRPLEIHDPDRELTLVYVHDVTNAMIEVLQTPPSRGNAEYRDASPVAHTTLSELAAMLCAYRQSRENAKAPAVSTDFGRKLYATYLSYLDSNGFDYQLARRADDRGTLAEFLKSDTAGQLFISRTRPGSVRGNHYHHTKTEKFLVVEGDGLIRLRRVDGRGEVLQYPVSGRDFRVVDIPPDYTHSIENVGSGELVVLFWSSEIFDPETPDTYPLKV